MINYNNEIIVKAPSRFDDYIINQLRDRYSDIINIIIQPLYNNTTINTYKSRIERHLFPILYLSDILGKNDEDLINLCRYIVKGYSLPILILDQSADTLELIDNKLFLAITNSIYDSYNILLLMRNGGKIAQTLSNTYSMVTKSVLDEYNNRYTIPCKHAVSKIILETSITYKYYRSVCGYMSAVIKSILIMNDIIISKELDLLLKQFGILRQVTDEISDVEDDLKSGVVTLPIMHVLNENYIEYDIKSYWNNRIGYEIIQEHILNHDGFERTFDMGMHIYKMCNINKDKLTSEYGDLIKGIFVFYDLKYGLLQRLKYNNWIDDKKNY